MCTIASQITSLTIVYWNVYSGADQSKHQSSASLAFVCGIHRGPVNSPHKWPVTRKMFPFDDVFMIARRYHSVKSFQTIRRLKWMLRINAIPRYKDAFRMGILHCSSSLCFSSIWTPRVWNFSLCVCSSLSFNRIRLIEPGTFSRMTKLKEL